MAGDVAQQRLVRNLKEGSYYEGQQQILTVYRRLKSKGNFAQCIELINNAVLALLDFRQAAYAVELVQGLLTDAQQWNGSQQEQTVQAAQELLHKFRQHKVDTAAYQPLANSAIKLARLCNTEDTAQRIPSLRSETGAYVFECRGLEGFDTACSYLAGGDVDRFEVVVLKASSGLSDEEAAYLHVYSLLKLLNSPQGDVEDREGRACLLYQGLLDSQKRELPISHFGQLLLKALRKPSPELFKLAVKEYRPALQKDPNLNAEVKNFESTILGSRRPASGIEGLLGSMFGSSLSVQ